MKQTRFWMVLSSALLAFISCTTQNIIKYPDYKTYPVQSQLEELLADPNLQNAMVGIYIEDLQSGEVIYKQNEHKLFVPASNMKIYTSAASIVNLGEEFRFETGLYADGELNQGVLNGNLIIRGSGDPAISGRYYDNDVLAIFRNWADSLKTRGILKIEGKLIGDDSYFSGSPLRQGWEWDDESFYYAPQISALSFNDNCVDFSIRSGNEVGDTVIVEINPLTDYVDITNNAMTINPDSLGFLDIWRERGQNRVHINGQLIQGGEDVESITIENPTEYFLDVFYRVLEGRGIEISEGFESVSTNILNFEENITLLFKHYSPTLAELTHTLNKRSNNFFAEQFLSTLGAQYKKRGTARAGREVVSNWVQRLGVASDEFIMVDGSGLARQNMIAPSATASVLRYMYHHKSFDTFLQTLPIAGLDGTIKYQMRGTVAQGRVFAKTGTLTRARALSGYIRTTDNRMLLFVTMFNNYPVTTSYIKGVQDRICILLSSWELNKSEFAISNSETK